MAHVEVNFSVVFEIQGFLKNNLRNAFGTCDEIVLDGNCGVNNLFQTINK
jgi:hypothetical protein